MKIQAAIAGETLTRLSTQIRDLLRQSPALGEILTSLDSELADFQQRGFLSVAFVGEYSAGKSTIISALTHRRDIRISADVATDRATEYPWNGINVVDTPGLWTENPDHDRTTLDAIRRSDLLVFCLTYTLFDTITLANFQKLAFDENYQRKMLLVLNKMSAESGSDEEKIEAYTASLAESLQPRPLDAFPIFFIDALDYVDGTDRDDAELRQMSRMDSFISGINRFVADRGTMAKLDTPIRIAIGHLDMASDKVLRDEVADDAYAEIISRLGRTVDKNRNAMRATVEETLQTLRSSIGAIGRQLASEVDGELDLTGPAEAAQSKAQALAGAAQEKIQATVESTAASLAKDLGKELQSPLLTAFLKRLEQPSVDVDIRLSKSSTDIRSRVSQLNRVTTAISTPVNAALMKGGQSVAGLGLTAKTAANTALHKGVLSVGKAMGYKFKGWQAVNIAKNIGKGVAVLGAAVQIASIASEIHGEFQEEGNAKKLLEAKRDIINDFQNFASSNIEELREALISLEATLFNQTEAAITEARKEHEQTVAGGNVIIRSIIGLRQQLHELLALVGAGRAS